MCERDSDMILSDSSDLVTEQDIQEDAVIV